MNDLQIFNSDEFGEVRTVLVENEPMFCLTDICKALQLTQPSKVKLFDIVVPVRLNEIIISFLGIDTYSYQYNCCSFDECGDVYEEYDFDTNDFGKSIFLTKAEAEAKLEELRGGE